MHIVVLAKAVPNTTGVERFEPDRSLDRVAAEPILNPNDEYALELALRLAEIDPGIMITMLTMGPEASWPGLTKGLAVGAQAGVLVSDPALAGACALSTARVLAAALDGMEYDLVLAGSDTSDGKAGVVGAAVAALLDIPFITHAGELTLRDGAVEGRRTRDDGYEVLAAPLPALVTVTQEVGEMRYPTLRGIMGSRSKMPVALSLDDIGLSAADVGGAVATTVVVDVDPPAPRPPARVVSGDAAEVADEVVRFLVDRRFIP